MVEFTDINKNLNNGQNMGGIAQKVYFGYWDDVLTWPAKPGPCLANSKCCPYRRPDYETGQKAFQPVSHR
jgi:hypothetical protein